MQNAMLSAFFGGVACSVIGVFVVLMHMPFIGVCVPRFCWGLLGVCLRFEPMLELSLQPGGGSGYRPAGGPR